MEKMKKLIYQFILAAFIVAVNVHASDAPKGDLPAFPTAEGFGMLATGGRGGKVVAVTSLLDDLKGETLGSLRWALKQCDGEPTTIVFRTSGVITLLGDLRSKLKNVTIAGQTAPGDGICIRGGKTNLGGSDNLILRHLRFRIGLADDGSFIKGGAIGIENARNLIIDHCTFGWSGEENMTMYDNDYTTVQWCIVHEGLYASGHGKGVRGYGSQWGGQNATYHHNLLAHNVSRTPRFNGSKHHDVNVVYDYINNVNYNWGKPNSAYGAYIEIDSGTYQCNFINNYYKPGPAYPGRMKSFFAESSYSSKQGIERIAKWYLGGNYMEGSANKELNGNNALGLSAAGYEKAGVSWEALISSEPFETEYPVEAEPALDAYHRVLAGAGAFPRDSVDERIVTEVSTGTASGKGTTEKHLNKDGVTYGRNKYFGLTKGIIDNPVAAFGEAAYPVYETFDTILDEDLDGMDDRWEFSVGLDSSNPADRNRETKSGYTCLEVYINGLVGEEIALEF